MTEQYLSNTNENIIVSILQKKKHLQQFGIFFFAISWSLPTLKSKWEWEKQDISKRVTDLVQTHLPCKLCKL